MNIRILTVPSLSTCILASPASASSGAYERSNSSRTIRRAVSIHSGSQLCFLKYSSLWRGWRTKNVVTAEKLWYRLWKRTHSNTVDLGMVCFIVIPVNGIFANSQGSANGERELEGTFRWRGKNFVDVIHCRYHSGEVGCSARKKECSVLKDLFPNEQRYVICSNNSPSKHPSTLQQSSTPLELTRTSEDPSHGRQSSNQLPNDSEWQTRACRRWNSIESTRRAAWYEMRGGGRSMSCTIQEEEWSWSSSLRRQTCVAVNVLVIRAGLGSESTDLYQHRSHWLDTRIQRPYLLVGHSISKIFPWIQRFVFFIILLSHFSTFFQIEPFGQLGECFSSFIKVLSFFTFGTSNCLIIALAAMLSVCAKQQVWFAAPGKLSIRSVRCTIIVSLLDALSVVMLRIYHFGEYWCISVSKFLTFSWIPNVCRTSANAFARFSPVWDMGTSTRSSSIDNGFPSCSRWTVIATKALWFGDVQASVAKLSFPSYSWWSVSQVIHTVTKTDLKHCSNAITNTHKNLFHITRDGFRWRYVAFGSTRLHERAKTAIIDNLEWALAFCDPPDKFSTIIQNFRHLVNTRKGENIPWFSFCMLTMIVGYPTLPSPLEGCGNCSVEILSFGQSLTSSL